MSNLGVPVAQAPPRTATMQHADVQPLLGLRLRACERLAGGALGVRGALREVLILTVAGRSVLWCPNAKAGTTFVREMFNRIVSMRKNARPLHSSANLSRFDMEELCAGEAVSFTVARDPWSRILSAYISKIAGEESNEHAAHLSANKIRLFHGLNTSAPVSFSHFLQWLRAPGNAANPNQLHFYRHSLRCEPKNHSYSLTAHSDTLSADLMPLLRWLRVPADAAIPPSHLSSTDRCSKSPPCDALLSLQAGKTWKLLSSQELLRAMYRSDPRNDLVKVVREVFAEDVAQGGFSSPLL